MGFSPALAVIGGIVSGVGALAGAANANASAQFEAKQLEMQAAEERAGASREAEEKRHEANLVASRAQAVAAASGGGAGSDAPTVQMLGGQIAGRGEYNALASLWGGEQRARGLIDSAKSRRASGQSALTAGLFDAGSSILTGFSRAKGYG